MSRLITRNTLLRGETDYVTDDSDKVTKFWLVDSRKKLLECKGRIRVSEQSSGRRKSHPYIGARKSSALRREKRRHR